MRKAAFCPNWHAPAQGMRVGDSAHALRALEHRTQETRYPVASIWLLLKFVSVANSRGGACVATGSFEVPGTPQRGHGRSDAN